MNNRTKKNILRILKAGFVLDDIPGDICYLRDKEMLMLFKNKHQSIWVYSPDDNAKHNIVFSNRALKNTIKKL